MRRPTASARSDGLKELFKIHVIDPSFRIGPRKSRNCANLLNLIGAVVRAQTRLEVVRSMRPASARSVPKIDVVRATTSMEQPVQFIAQQRLSHTGLRRPTHRRGPIETSRAGSARPMTTASCKNPKLWTPSACFSNASAADASRHVGAADITPRPIVTANVSNHRGTMQSPPTRRARSATIAGNLVFRCRRGRCVFHRHGASEGQRRTGSPESQRSSLQDR